MEQSPTLRRASTVYSWKEIAICASVYFAATPASAWITAAGLPVWLATGVAIWALGQFGLRYWPAVLASGWLSAIAMGYAPVMAAPLAVTGLAEALVGLAILRSGVCLPKPRRSLMMMLSTALVVVVVPAMGATFAASLQSMAAGLTLPTFAAAWTSWWMKDAIGLLLLAPLWTVRPIDAPLKEHAASTSAAENLLNLQTAILAFEPSARVVVTESQQVPVRTVK